MITNGMSNELVNVSIFRLSLLGDVSCLKSKPVNNSHCCCIVLKKGSKAILNNKELIGTSCRKPFCCNKGEVR